MILLDTHIWIWWLHGEKQLPKSFITMIESAEDIAVSTATVYEITFLASRNRIILNLPIDIWLKEATTESNVRVLPITEEIAEIAGRLEQHHGDPMDRMIIAIAIEYQASLMSFDEKFQLYTEIQDKLIHKKQK